MTKVTAKKSLIGLSVAELEALFVPFKQPRYRASQVYKWLHHFQVTSFDEMTNLPKQFREILAEQFTLGELSLKARQESKDGTRKYLWSLPDGNAIESVYIPEDKRTTICISSQVGCALGCEFCATAQMGFLANLTAGQIVEQVIRVQQDNPSKITNVVFMGMGEPFLNYNRVIAASKILSDPEGLAISAQKVTISTVGIVPRIIQFTDERHPYKLAISLHAPNQELRRSIMPVADKFSLEELMESAHYYTRHQTRKRITFEYVLLEGVNDTPDVARELLSLLAPLRCKLNLIPYNDTGIGFRLPGELRLQQFLKVLEPAPFTVTVRKNRGTDIAAACGQLIAESTMPQVARSLKKPAKSRQS